MLGLISMTVMAFSLWDIQPYAWFVAMFWIALGLIAYLLYSSKEKIVAKAEEAPADDIIEKPHGSDYCVMAAVAGPEDTPIVELAALVSRIEGGDLHLLHVIEMPDTDSLDSVSYSRVSRERRALTKAQKIAEDIRARVHTKIVVSHKAAEAIIGEAKETKASVLFLGWKGRHGTDIMMGSNLDKIVQDAPCDVVIYKAKGMPEDVFRILVVSTGEGNETYAVGMAILLAKRYKASISLLGVATGEQDRERSQELVNRLAQICDTHGVSYERRTELSKDVEQTVCSASQDHEVVVIGEAEESRLRQFLLRSLPDRLAQRMTKPLIIVQKVQPRESAPEPEPQSAVRLLEAASKNQ
jgi:APA family basic amino acid/polyamine antiporter